jgi:hypothetical protein
VRIVNGKFTLHGRPFFLRGTNYFGSWRYANTFDQGDGVEQATTWAFFHYWDSHKLDLDFKFLRARLNATALRIGTPAASDIMVIRPGMRPTARLPRATKKAHRPGRDRRR